ncbi:MAG: hypothetical protein NUW23_00420 [Firmicutes bacterium]|jgi:hypothetical protein|nr:hypothetical protein [Bacillota bacterium]
MKKSLILAIAALVVVAMVAPANAATLKVDGRYYGYWEISWPTEPGAGFSPWTFDSGSQLRLNLTFKEGDAITAYLPLRIYPVFDTIGESSTRVGKIWLGHWYAAYETAPFSFWISDSHTDGYSSSYSNPKRFESLGDPLGIADYLGVVRTSYAKTSADDVIVLNMKGSALGANVNVYGVDSNKSGENWSAVLGRVTVPLPADFTLGSVLTYTENPAAGGFSEATPQVIVGADLQGKVPGIGGDLTIAAAGSFYFDAAEDAFVPYAEENTHIAYQAKVENLALGPVTAYAKWTAVGDNFVSPFQLPDDDEPLLYTYRGLGVAEAGVTASLPAGVPATLTLSDKYVTAFTGGAEYNETKGSVEVTPIPGLVATVSGAYKVDLDEDAETNYDGYKGYGSLAYTVFGTTFKGYVDYLNGATYADTGDVDTIVGITVSGNPMAGLEIGAEASYEFAHEDDPAALDSQAWGIYTTEVAPAFFKSAKTQIAGVAEYGKVGSDEATTYLYGFLGSTFVVTDKLDGKVGVLTKDEGGDFVASATMNYKISSNLKASAEYTRRGLNLTDTGAASMLPSTPNDWFRATLNATLGSSTLAIGYGKSGIGVDVKDEDLFAYGKPWSYLYHNRIDSNSDWVPDSPIPEMKWNFWTLEITVPF